MRLKWIMCNIIGHDWRYSHPTMASKGICKNCYKKKQLKKLQWENVSVFKYESRTDEELSKMWFKQKY